MRVCKAMLGGWRFIKGRDFFGEGRREGLTFHLRAVKKASTGTHLEFDKSALDLGSQCAGFWLPPETGGGKLVVINYLRRGGFIWASLRFQSLSRQKQNPEATVMPTKTALCVAWTAVKPGLEERHHRIIGDLIRGACKRKLPKRCPWEKDAGVRLPGLASHTHHLFPCEVTLGKLLTLSLPQLWRLKKLIQIKLRNISVHNQH